MISLIVDLETYSDVDLTKSGVFPYAESPNFQVLLFGYAVNDEPARVVDLAQGERIPNEIVTAIFSPQVLKYAFNAPFEMACLTKHFGRKMLPESWRCLQAHALTLGLPRSLAAVGSALNLPADKQKDRNGPALIRYFCLKHEAEAGLFGPASARNLPKNSPEKWAQFTEYCRQDVNTERAVQKALKKHPISEQELWELDYKINAAGVEVDPVLIGHAIRCADLYQARLIEEAVKLTGLDNPQSVSQIKAWLKSAAGLEVESLNKESIPGLLKETNNETVRRVLEIRQELSKTSVKKYEAMNRSKCADNRIRGLFQYYGANRSGRWSGRLLQVQNLPQNKMPDLDLARRVLRAGQYEGIEMLWDSVPNVLSQLIRTALVAGKGKQFIISDFSAIEARIIAWLAGEEWRMEVFRTHGKIYEASASQMFKVPIEEITKGSPLRQKGKVAELACIAEGQPVLTERGLIPIEKVPPEVKVWDGQEWVKHQGPVYRGVKEVIEYDGLTATADHPVWVEGQEGPIWFGDAAAGHSRLLRGGNCRVALRAGEPSTELRKVYDLLNAGPRNRFTVSDCIVHNCGYGGGVGALKAMGALQMGLTEEELPALIRGWRNSNPNIVKLWWDAEAAAMKALQGGTGVVADSRVTYHYHDGILFAHLPSGRSLCYMNPRIEPDLRFNGKATITYEGYAQGRWSRLKTYGPKLVENLIQGIARDALAAAMIRLDRAGFSICLHIHDEVVIEAPEDQDCLQEVCAIMGGDLSWAPGLPLPAEGATMKYYKKI